MKRPLQYRKFFCISMQALFLVVAFFADKESRAGTKDVVVLISGKPEKSYKPSDPSDIVQVGLDGMADVLSWSESDAKQVHLELDNLDQLSSAIVKALGENDRLRGVVFLGHGNETEYGLDEREVYNGAQVAKHLLDTLQKVKVSPTFSVHFTGCSMHKLFLAKKSFRDVFIEKLIADAKDMKIGCKKIITTAHVEDTYPNKFDPPSSLEIFIYRFDAPIRLFKAAMKFLFSTPLIKGIAVSAYAGIGFALSHASEVPPLGKIFYWSLGVGAVAGSVIQYLRDHFVASKIIAMNSWENGKIVEQTGFADDLLQTAFGPDCESLQITGKIK